MPNIHDAIKYGWIDELASGFFYEKCHGYPEDIVKEIKQLITGVIEAQKLIESENNILEGLPL